MTQQIKILKLNRQGSKVSLTLTDREKPLIVSDDTVYRHRLVEGIVLTASQLEILQQESDRYRCEDTAARLLSMREHSTGELRQKLKRREFESTTIERTLRKYKSEGLLDDARYAYETAERILRDRPCGRSYLVASLRQKHIDRDLAEETVGMVIGDEEETGLAVRALQKKWREYGQLELEEARRKSYTYLARRGFSYDAAKRAFDKLARQ